MLSESNASKLLTVVLIFCLSLSLGWLPLSIGLKFEPILGTSLQNI
ncbi:MAG: hypothetical protein AAFQ80_08450 [Cyanobacteria bacterium J06621_8]